MYTNLFVTCPYNSTHRVQRSRIQAHLVKCEKKYPPLVICAYNATHRFPQSEIAYHIANCPSKDVDPNIRFKRYERPVFVDKAPQLKPGDPDYECWD